MLVEVKVPVLAESVPDATLLEWYKRPGERVERGESLIDLETDKVTLEVAAPESGVLVEIRKSTGEVALSDDVLAVIDTEATAAPPVPTHAAPPDDATGRLGPAVRKLVHEHGVDPSKIHGSGKDGRVTKTDVLAYLDTKAAVPPPPSAPMVQARPAEPEAFRPEERVPMTRLRKRAAERLLSAQHEAAILTTFNEVNMQPVMDVRQRHKDDFEKRYGVKLGFMSFFVKAAVEALKRFPVVNASVDGDDILYHGYFDIGVAVGSERGLVVPVLRDVDRMSFADIELKIKDSTGKLQPEFEAKVWQ